MLILTRTIEVSQEEYDMRKLIAVIGLTLMACGGGGSDEYSVGGTFVEMPVIFGTRIH